jgi:RimJ/RimL family protein N-acetyltransferase
MSPNQPPEDSARPDDELVLESSRLTLRDFRATDLADVHAMRSDPEAARYMLDFAPQSLEKAQDWLSEVIYYTRRRPRKAYNLAIVHRGDRRVIGWIGIGRSERYPAEGELGFGYLLNRAYWGQGYATEAVLAILAFGFTALGGRRSSAYCIAENRASARVLQKAGLRFVRTFEQPDPRHDTSVACEEYAIGIEEWGATAGPR